MRNWFRHLMTQGQPPRPSSCDPFANPDIARMSLRDLADLPLSPPPTPPRAAAPERAVRHASGARPRLDPRRAAAI
jgi:hypothetical protein